MRPFKRHQVKHLLRVVVRDLLAVFDRIDAVASRGFARLDELDARRAFVVDWLSLGQKLQPFCDFTGVDFLAGAVRDLHHLVLEVGRLRRFCRLHGKKNECHRIISLAGI